MTGPLVAERARLSREGLVADLVSIAHGNWDPQFRGDVDEVARFVLGRALGLVDDRIDCELSFGRVPLADITVLNPQRVGVTPIGGYPVLRARLEADPAYDSVPLAVGRSRRGTSVWDGHRRLETYRSAGRSDVPAWIATFRHGSGLVSIRG